MSLTPHEPSASSLDRGPPEYLIPKVRKWWQFWKPDVEWQDARDVPYDQLPGRLKP